MRDCGTHQITDTDKVIQLNIYIYRYIYIYIYIHILQNFIPETSFLYADAVSSIQRSLKFCESLRICMTFEIFKN